MRTITSLFSVTLLIVCASASSAAIVNFEGFGATNAPGAENSAVTMVKRQGVEVMFSAEDPATGTIITPILAKAGSPRVGFQSTLGDDIPMVAGGGRYTAGGDYSLTDGLGQTYDYILDFSSPVANLSLDLYDYRGDGPHASANLGKDSVVLQVFNSAGTQIGSDTYTLPSVRPIEGNVVTLGVNKLGIASARLHFNGIEGGTAIDNIMFAVPEPNTLGLASVALLGLMGLGRRRSA